MIVFNNDQWGAEKKNHVDFYSRRYQGVNLQNPSWATVARAFGCEGVTVRGTSDLGPVREWLDGPRDRPLVIDAKITSERGSWWLEEAFRGH